MTFKLAEQPFYVKLICILLALVTLGFLVIEGKKIVSPLIFACLFSILLLPVAKLQERKFHFGRNLAAVTSVLVLLLAVGGILFFMGSQISRLMGDWPQFKAQLGNSVNDVQQWVARSFHIDIDKQTNYVHEATNKLRDSGTAVAGATLISVSSILLFSSLTIIYTFFFLLYRRLILKFLVQVFGPDNNHLVFEIVEEVQYIIRRYITGLLIEMISVITFVSIVFSLLGVKYAILLGLMTGILNLIPYIGIATSMLISSLITFATAASTAKVLWIIAILFGTHVVDVNLLLPLIVGSKVKINPMITLLGIIIGEMIWGIAGMFLSIPVIAVLKIIFDRVEALKPWGLLLGEDDAASNRKLEKRKRSLEEKDQGSEAKS